jgi:hypothetical protein
MFPPPLNVHGRDMWFKVLGFPRSEERRGNEVRDLNNNENLCIATLSSAKKHINITYTW